MKKYNIIVLLFVVLFFIPLLSHSEQVDEPERINELCDLFDEQIQTLEDRGCSELIITPLLDQKYEVVERAFALTIKEGNVPFLPVIPEPWLSIYAQVKMVHKDRGIGYTELDPSCITNEIRTPSDPYYIFDVEKGDERIGMSPSESKRWINIQGRSSLTTEEIISLCVHTNVLEKHFVDGANSRVNERGVPSFKLVKGAPCLDWCFFEAGTLNCGTPSCYR